jgi:glycosyltransferase 2 family protein
MNNLNPLSRHPKMSTKLKFSPVNIRRSQTKIWGIIRAIISFALLIAVLKRIDLGPVVKVALSVKISWLLSASMVAVTGRLFAAFRWYLLLQGKNPEATFGRVLKLLLISSLLGMFMPGGIGVDVVRVYGMSKTTSDSALAFSSVLVERILAIFVQTLLVILGLWLAPVALPFQISLAAWIWFLALTMIILILMLSLPRTLFDRLLIGRFLGSVRIRMHNFYCAMDTYKGQPKLLAVSLLAAIVAIIFRIIPTVLIARALNIDIPLVYFVIFLPIIHFVAQMPISIGGLGVRETSFVYFLGMIGVSSEKAFTLSIVVYALTLIIALPGAWLYAREGLISTNPGGVSSSAFGKNSRIKDINSVKD